MPMTAHHSQPLRTVDRALLSVRVTSGAWVRKDACVEWSAENRERLEVALTEADIVGVQRMSDDSIALRAQVLALPEEGPIDIDARRQVVLHGVTQARFLLRCQTVEGYGPEIPLASIEAVDQFLDTLGTGDSLYGWHYFDDPELTDDWPSEPSLVVQMDDSEPQHSFYWFNECARMEEGEIHNYVLEGDADFADLTVLRADGTPQPVSEFADQGVRWWQAFTDHEDRVGSDAQGAWNSSHLTWRRWPGLPSIPS